MDISEAVHNMLGVFWETKKVTETNHGDASRICKKYILPRVLAEPLCVGFCDAPCMAKYDPTVEEMVEFNQVGSRLLDTGFKTNLHMHSAYVW